MAACALALGACGGGGSSTAVTGPAVFARSCSGCHSMIGNESRHTSGGDLLSYALGRSAVLQYTREMPLRRPLSPAQLQAVVDYVLHAERPARAARQAAP